MWKIKCKLPSTNKLFRVLYWTLYLGLCFISGWFVSGVLENYISRKTSFSQDEEIATKRPVITIKIHPLSGEKPVLNNNTWIKYCQSYKLWSTKCKYLAFGENEFLIKEINETEKVFFEEIKVTTYFSFRIIPLTNLLEEKAKAGVRIYTLKAKLKHVYIILTSLENSLGNVLNKNKDGEPLWFRIEENQLRQFAIRPESYNFLPQTSNCHQESYYDCLTSELDKFDFSQTSCTTKCIPRMFSYGKNYSTPLCQNFEKDDKCARNIFDDRYNKIENNFTNIVKLRCKHACTILQYSGMEAVARSYQIFNKTHDFYHGEYKFENPDNKMKVFSQYLIYDSMAMIGSVGGTFGMFIGFSMTGVISTIIEFFKEQRIGRKILV